MTKIQRLNVDFVVCKQLVTPRFEEFVPSIHHAGRFGSEGIPARVLARARLLRGIELRWIRSNVRNPLPQHLEVLLSTIVSIRLAWLGERGIGGRVDRMREEVLGGSPMFIVRELACNAFDSHARANRQGRIGLNAYRHPDGSIVVDVSDDGIGFKSVIQGPSFITLLVPEVDRGWSPFPEGEVGVGLLWSKLLAELHEGTIEFLRNIYPHQRTTVRVSFPAGVVEIVGSLGAASS